MKDVLSRFEAACEFNRLGYFSEYQWQRLRGALVAELLEVVEKDREARPAYNHTRGDSPLTPCPLCARAPER